jgi:hypothetical protein
MNIGTTADFFGTRYTGFRLFCRQAFLWSALAFRTLYRHRYKKMKVLLVLKPDSCHIYPAAVLAI